MYSKTVMSDCDLYSSTEYDYHQTRSSPDITTILFLSTIAKLTLYK